MSDTCQCGDVEDEHEDSFLAPCTIEDCPCGAYDWDGEDDDE